jgi:hypothetical protein
MIPLHLTNSSCVAAMEQPITSRSIGIAVLFSIGCGAVMAVTFHPAWPSPFAMFAIFGGIAGVLATAYLRVRYPPYLVIWDGTSWDTGRAEYEAYFRDEACAAAFADLNRDILRPWTRPRWLDPLLRWR